ncbi:trigger factor [Candidatus Peribacteria bacterium]|nr:MAG: trigger factor [Candidatus Peribacteria bacterium]
MSAQNISVERLPKSRVVCTASFTKEEQTAAEEHALSHLASNVNIKGFRVGHAPADMVRNRIPKDQLLEETVRELVRTALPAIIDEHKILPVIPPKIEIVTAEPLSVKITFVERPVVKVKNIDTLKIEKKTIKADEKDVNRVVESVLNDHRTSTEVERAATENDRLMLNFHATNDQGTEITGMRAEGYDALIGSNTLLPGFEEQLKGLKKGDSKSFTLTLPEKFQEESLRGKQATFHVTVTKVEETKLPELNDTFAKEKLNAPSAAEFRSIVEKSITMQEEQFDRMRRERELMDEIRKRTDVEIADELLDEEMRGLIDEWSQQLERQNMTIADALKKEGKTVEQAEADLKKQAEDRWKLRLGMAKLIEEKGVTVTDEEVAASGDNFISGLPEEQKVQARKEFDSHGNLYEELRWRALVEKVMEGLLA